MYIVHRWHTELSVRLKCIFRACTPINAHYLPKTVYNETGHLISDTRRDMAFTYLLTARTYLFYEILYTLHNQITCDIHLETRLAVTRNTICVKGSIWTDVFYVIWYRLVSLMCLGHQWSYLPYVKCNDAVTCVLNRSRRYLTLWNMSPGDHFWDYHPVLTFLSSQLNRLGDKLHVNEINRSPPYLMSVLTNWLAACLLGNVMKTRRSRLFFGREFVYIIWLKALLWSHKHFIFASYNLARKSKI